MKAFEKELEELNEPQGTEQDTQGREQRPAG